MVLRTLRILWIFGYWNILWNYLEVNYIFWIHLTCELLMWVCPYAMMLVITSSLWWQVRLEAPILHYIGKSLIVWVRLLPIRPKDHMQKRYCVMRHSLLPMGRRGKFLSVWMRLGKAKRPHAKEVLHDVLYPAAHRGIGKFLRVWVRLGKANKPHAKRGTYNASGLWVLTCLYGDIMSPWHFRLCGGLSCGLDWLFRFLEQCCCAHSIYIM